MKKKFFVEIKAMYFKVDVAVKMLCVCVDNGFIVDLVMFV